MNVNKKPVCLFHFQCPLTDICENNQCFWKQRDCYGRSAFLYFDEDYTMKSFIQKNEEIISKYGEPYFPTMKGSTGTNTIGLYCEDFMKEDWGGGIYCRDDDKERSEKLKRSIYCWGPKNG
jgi:uncharacterized protein YjhX (UPF0386 family)